MKKFILSIIFCLIICFSLNTLAQENPFSATVYCMDCNVGFSNIRLLLYTIFIIILVLSLIGLFFKKIRKVCKWILIIGTILFILVASADSVVYHAVNTPVATGDDIAVFLKDTSN